MPATLDPRWHAARRILAIRIDNLGDVLMTTPALAAIKASASDVQLTLLTSPAGAGIAAHTSLIDDLIVHDVPWARGGPATSQPQMQPQARSPEADLQLIERLRAGRFDAAIVFTVCTQSALPAALMCRLAGIPLCLAHCRENPYDLLSDWRPDTEVVATGMRHEVTRQLDLVRSVGFDIADDRLRFDLHADDRERALLRLQAAYGDSRRPWLLVHPGASAPSRRWPAERMGRAARDIASAVDCQVLIVGGYSEATLVDAAARACGPCGVTLTGLSLGELAGLIAGARLMICNNSGPMHIAAALGTPLVALYALTNPQHTPWRVPAAVLSHDVPCRNCLKSTCPQPGHPCLLDVTTEDVVAAGLRLIESQGPQWLRCLQEPHEPQLLQGPQWPRWRGAS